MKVGDLVKWSSKSSPDYYNGMVGENAVALILSFTPAAIQARYNHAEVAEVLFNNGKIVWIGTHNLEVISE
jgi:hypothetical protein